MVSIVKIQIFSRHFTFKTGVMPTFCLMCMGLDWAFDATTQTPRDQESADDGEDDAGDGFGSVSTLIKFIINLLHFVGLTDLIIFLYSFL